MAKKATKSFNVEVKYPADLSKADLRRIKKLLKDGADESLSVALGEGVSVKVTETEGAGE